MIKGLICCLVLASPVAAADRQIALTFDDLPGTRSRDVNDRIIAKLAAHRAPAIGFVNESKLGGGREVDPERVAALRRWLDAGLELGNHTYSHVSIDRASFEEYRDDLIRGEVVTSRLLRERGKRLEYFRHPQLRTGPTEEYRRKLNALLTQRGYTTAPVTIDNDDYIYAHAYDRAKARNDRALMREIATSYIDYMERVFVHFENVSRDFLGYEPRQVLLLHANEINGDHLDKLLAMMKRRGYRFITLREALQDRAYRLPDAQAQTGLSWIHRWMLAKGQSIRPEPRPPARIRELMNR